MAGISVMIAGGVDHSVTELAVGFADVFQTTVLDDIPAATTLGLPHRMRRVRLNLMSATIVLFG
ncbi:hypothetical protein QP185_18315 [Sphingomonas aerolata]|uniref:hypothetical protein n=1 Tax=Sphingomonas aerolata TaxID=185951 RepID=UPI002FE37074